MTVVVVVWRVLLAPCPTVLRRWQMYPRMTGQLVRSRKALVTSRMGTGVGLFTSVRPDVPRLVLQSIEGTIAQWTLVGTGDLALVDVEGRFELCLYVWVVGVQSTGRRINGGENGLLRWIGSGFRHGRVVAVVVIGRRGGGTGFLLRR